MAREHRARGLSVGAAIATIVTTLIFGLFLLYLGRVTPTSIGPDSGPVIRDSSAKEPDSVATILVEAPIIEVKNPYEFYKLLHESEVPDQAVAAYTPKATNSQNSIQDYRLQAGSFRRYTDADRLRANLLLKGLDAKLSTITNSRGETWHRILVGPFSSRSRLNHAQDILADANTESMLVKIN